MGTGEQLRLQANFGNQLRRQLQMTPTTDALLQLRYDPSPMLRRDFLILLVELCIYSRNRLLPLLLRSHHSAAQGLLFLVDVARLHGEFVQRCLRLLFLHPIRLTLLVCRFHKRQELVL